MSCQVRICKKCSGIAPKDLKGVVDKKHRKTGCFGVCAKKHPELKGRVYVKVDGELMARDSKKKLVRALAEAV